VLPGAAAVVRGASSSFLVGASDAPPALVGGVRDGQRRIGETRGDGLARQSPRLDRVESGGTGEAGATGAVALGAPRSLPPYDVPRGVGVSYVRGTPVWRSGCAGRLWLFSSSFVLSIQVLHGP